MTPQITYKFRCPSCPYSTEVRDRAHLPAACPICGAATRQRDTAAVLKKPGVMAEDRRH